MAQGKDRVIRSAKLVWQGDGGAIQEQMINEGATIVIGRDPASDIMLSNKLVSKRHALLYWQEGSCVIADQNSANGTLVNGKTVKEVRVLQDEDRIEIGETVLSYYFLGERMVEAMKTMPLPQADAQPEARPAAPATVNLAQTGGPKPAPETQRLVEDLPTMITDMGAMEAKLSQEAAQGAAKTAPEVKEMPTLAISAADLEAAAASGSRPASKPAVVQPPPAPPEAPAPAPQKPVEAPAPVSEDPFMALLDHLRSSQSSAQAAQGRWLTMRAKLEKIVERLEASTPRMAELSGKVNEAGLIDLLDQLAASPTDVNLLVGLAKHASLLSRMIKGYYNQEAALNLIAKELDAELKE